MRLIRLVLLSSAIALPSHAQSVTAQISGRVIDPVGHVLPGVAVTLEASEGGFAADALPVRRFVASTFTDATGRFAFDAIPAGTFIVSAVLSGYSRGEHRPITVTAGQSVSVELALGLAPISEVVSVVGSTGAGDPIEQDQFGAEFLRIFQLPSDRFQEALPLLPGVVRDPRGRLSFNGTRPSQSTLLVNGANATDPVTGQFAVEVPLSVIDTVEVHAIPYSAEFGRVSGAVANVLTLAGDDHWDLTADSLVPTPRFRGSTLMGINRATPRVRVSGPLQRGRAWFSQAFSYRFVRSRVEEKIAGPDEEVVEGFDAFTQVDFKVNDRHSIMGTLSIFPVEVDNVGINSLNPAIATPDLDSGGWNVAIANTMVTRANTLWRTLFAFRGFDVAVRPQGLGPARLTPDGMRRNYFNEIDRRSRQLEVGGAYLRSWRVGGQEHLLKIGGQLFSTWFDGIDRSGPIEIQGADGRLLRRISFVGSGELDASDVLASGYVQDHWKLGARLALDLGMRYDYDRMLRESHLSPRVAFSLALDESGRTLVKGGWGVFFDQVFLQADAFGQFQQRVEQDFAGADTPVTAPLIFRNEVDPEGLDEPTSRVCNVEFDRTLGSALMLRINYRENRTRDRLLIDRVMGLNGPALFLSSAGRMTGREFDLTVRWTPGTRGELFVSYSKIRAKGDLNDFGVLYDNLRSPLVLPNEQARQPFEVPHRVLVWGVVNLANGFTLTPGFEWRTGFPYTIYAEDYSVPGGQNGERFPRFLSADLRVTKRMELFGRQVDVGFQAFNLTAHDNPRDVISNLASPSFGQFRNSVGPSVALKLGLDLSG